MAAKALSVLVLFALGIAVATARPVGEQVARASPPAGAGTLQLDVCHRTDAPSMVLEVSDAGVCTITSRVLSSANTTAAAAAGALSLSFPCAASAADSPAAARLEGPALNIWAELPAPGGGVAAASASDDDAGARARARGGGCTLTTMNPVLHFHQRTPALLRYGYAVRGLECSTSSGKAGKPMIATASPNSGTAGVVYGLSLVPSLPTPSAQSRVTPRGAQLYSTEEQRCRLVVTAMGRIFMHQSNGTYPCTLVVDPDVSLGPGRCLQ